MRGAGRCWFLLFRKEKHSLVVAIRDDACRHERAVVVFRLREERRQCLSEEVFDAEGRRRRFSRPRSFGRAGTVGWWNSLGGDLGLGVGPLPSVALLSHGYFRDRVRRAV